MRRAALIHNPAAGRRLGPAELERLLEGLRRGGFEVDPVPTVGPGSATRLARELAASGREVLFSLGGDGTLREVAAGILGTDTVLAPLPGGTVNVVAYSLGLPSRPAAAVEALGRGHVRELDVGLCGNDPFLMQTSVGLDARALASVDPTLKRRIGRAAVGWAAIGAWRRYDFPTIDLTADGDSLLATFAAVCNLPHYGGRVELAPAARPDDGRLHLVVFRGRGAAATLAFARDLWLGRHLGRADVESRQVSQVEIRGPADASLQIDGDPLAAAPPRTIRLASRRLRILAP